jgi:hypothetical protein
LSRFGACWPKQSQSQPQMRVRPGVDGGW